MSENRTIAIIEEEGSGLIHSKCPVPLEILWLMLGVQGGVSPELYTFPKNRTEIPIL